MDTRVCVCVCEHIPYTVLQGPGHFGATSFSERPAAAIQQHVNEAPLTWGC